MSVKITTTRCVTAQKSAVQIYCIILYSCPFGTLLIPIKCFFSIDSSLVLRLTDPSQFNSNFDFVCSVQIVVLTVTNHVYFPLFCYLDTTTEMTNS